MRPYREILLLASFLLGSCAAQVGYQREYVSEAAPGYMAEAEIVVLMHDHDLEYVYEGGADSPIGAARTLTMPIGDIMQEVAARVFQSCFMYGVVFTEELVPDMRYIIAIEPEIRDFTYRFERQVEEGLIVVGGPGLEGAPVTSVTPSVQFELTVKAYNSSADLAMEKTYPSGLVSGEKYYATFRPYERINETFHRALQDVMLAVAEDIRPLLVGKCEITDVSAHTVN